MAPTEFHQFPGFTALWALTGLVAVGLHPRWRDMEEKSLFISSLSRRELNRRRPNRLLPPVPIAVIMLAVAMAAIGIFLAVRGSL